MAVTTQPPLPQSRVKSTEQEVGGESSASMKLGGGGGALVGSLGRGHWTGGSDERRG